MIPPGSPGAFDGLLEVVGRSGPLVGADGPDAATTRRPLQSALEVPVRPAPAEADHQVHDHWTRDGIDGAEISGDAGSEPRSARVLRPSGQTAPLPGAMVAPEGGLGSVQDTPYSFDLAMQHEAFGWLADQVPASPVPTVAGGRP